MAVSGSHVMSGIDGTIDLEFLDDVAILRMNRGDNRINDDFIKRMSEALEEVERNKNIRVLITTGNGKFFSNGLDLAWMNYVTAHEENADVMVANMRRRLQDLYWRIVTFPVITVAALNGHTYAAGALLSMAHDYRVMRTGRGWWCLNEVYTGVRLWRMPPLLKLKLSPEARLEATVLGRRFTAEDALKQGVVDKICGGDELIEQSVTLAREVIKRGLPSRENLHAMKHRIYGEIIREDAAKL